MHGWHSPRIGRHMGVVVYGHWGPPLLAFPTSGGDEREMEGQGLIPALADFIDSGRVKVFTVNALTQEGFWNKGAHPFHRSWVQSVYASYIRQEVIPFIHDHCRGLVPVTTMGMSLGAYHAANTLLKYPDAVKRCFALSGVYDLSSFMDGMYDDNFYFNNPAHYVPNLHDPWTFQQLETCDIHLATGNGPYENSGPTYHFSGILASKGIRHSLDDWGPLGGHDWPYWKHQMREYLGKYY